MREPHGEFARIARIVSALPRGEGVVLGAGDDAAVLRPGEGRDLVATCDALVEGRHFRRDLLTPAEAGARMAAANLSDLAAMAAEPRWALVSLAVPASWSAADSEALERSCAERLAAEGATIVGGNLSATDGPLVATVTLLGEVERGRAWTRSGARPGDVLAVTGAPGSAAAFLALALAGRPVSRAGVPEALVARFTAPVPRVRLARALAATGAVRAAIDVSDGLSADLAHLCRASRVGALVEEAMLPTDEALLAASRALSAVEAEGHGILAGEGERLMDLRLGPSDDFELVLAVDPGAWERCAEAARSVGAPLTRIGELTAGPRLELRDHAGELRPLEPRGWDHFPES